MTDARTALYQYGAMQAEVKRIEKRINEAREIMEETCEPLRAFVAQQTPPGITNRTSDPTVSAVERLIDIYEKEIRRLSECLSKVMEDIREVDEVVISADLTHDEYNIIQYYYFDGKRWDWISETMHYSERHCRRFRDAAVKKINAAYKHVRQCPVICGNIEQ